MISFEEHSRGPEWLATLIDMLFDEMPNKDAKGLFGIVKAIPEGKDKLWFDRLKWKFCAFLMRENLAQQEVADLPSNLNIRAISVIRGILTLLVLALETNVWDVAAAAEAEVAARSVAKSAESMVMMCSVKSIAWSETEVEVARAEVARVKAERALKAETRIWSARSVVTVTPYSVAYAARTAAEAGSVDFKRSSDEIVRLMGHD